MTSVSYSDKTKLNCEIKELTDAWWEGKTRVGWQSLGSESRGSVQYSVDMQLTAQCLCGSVCACVFVCLYAKHKGNGMWVARKVMVCDLQRDLRNTLQSHPRLPSTVCLLLNENKWQIYVYIYIYMYIYIYIETSNLLLPTLYFCLCHRNYTTTFRVKCHTSGRWQLLLGWK